MNKLREELIEAWNKPDSVQQCEQITDDFSISFADFVIKYNDTHRVHKTPTELQQYFKENVYGK
jgi:hypothetical protein